MFEAGDVVVCADSMGMEGIFHIGHKYVVDKVCDGEHICVKGFPGAVHSDRFYKDVGSDSHFEKSKGI